MGKKVIKPSKKKEVKIVKKKTVVTKEKKEKETPLIIDEIVLNEQMLKDESSFNFVVEEGVKMIREGKRPGLAVIRLLTLLKIIK